MDIVVNTKALAENVSVPAYATQGDAGMDLRALESGVINPGERKLVKTGLAMAIPEGYVGFVCPRSGLALKNGVTVLNAPGVVDSGYRNDVGVILINLGDEPFEYEGTTADTEGTRVAQMVFSPVANAQLNLVDDLDETDRGMGGFGSTGLN